MNKYMSKRFHGKDTFNAMIKVSIINIAIARSMTGGLSKCGVFSVWFLSPAHHYVLQMGKP